MDTNDDMLPAITPENDQPLLYGNQPDIGAEVVEWVDDCNKISPGSAFGNLMQLGTILGAALSSDLGLSLRASVVLMLDGLALGLLIALWLYRRGHMQRGARGTAPGETRASPSAP